MPSNPASRKKKSVKLNPKLFLKRIGFICFIIYIAATFFSQQKSLNANAQLAKEYENKIHSAQQEQEALKSELEDADSEMYLERMAREKLGMVKSNERVFIDATKSN